MKGAGVVQMRTGFQRRIMVSWHFLQVRVSRIEVVEGWRRLEGQRPTAEMMGIKGGCHQRECRIRIDDGLGCVIGESLEDGKKSDTRASDFCKVDGRTWIIIISS